MHYWIAIGLCFALNAWAVSDDFLRDEVQLRKKYAYLYSLPVIEEPGGERRFHNARLMRRSGINVLALRGNAFEMAFQHGKLLAPEISVGAVIGSSKMIERAVDNTFMHRPLYRAAAKKVIDRDYTTALLRNAVNQYPAESRSVLEKLFAISEAAGVPMPTVLDGALAPSVMMMLANGSDKELATIAPTNSCTSFVAWGRYTLGGEMLIARNTDYPLSDYFEKGSTVIYFQPSDGEQKVMAISTAGVHSASVTGINEFGIYLGTHSLPSTATGVVGTPMIMWMHEALAKSKTVDEVIKRLTKFPSEVGWTYVVASDVEKRVVSVEVDNAGFGIRESTSGKHVQTNHYLTRELGPRTLYFNQGTREETWNRYVRVDSLVEASKGTLDEKTAIRILGDHWDAHSNAQNGFPSNVGATTTVSSIVYRPANRSVLVATGYAPVSHNAYLRFPVPADFEESSFASQNLDVLEDDWFQMQFPSRFDALKRYIRAKQMFEYQYDVTSARKLTQEAADLAPSVGHYRLMQGLLEIRLNRFGDSLKSLDQAIASTLSPHGQALGHYYRARILADQNREKEAIESLRLALQVSPPDSSLIGPIRRAGSAIKKPTLYRLHWYDVVPQFQFGDSQTY